MSSSSIDGDSELQTEKEDYSSISDLFEDDTDTGHSSQVLSDDDDVADDKVDLLKEKFVVNLPSLSKKKDKKLNSYCNAESSMNNSEKLTIQSIAKSSIQSSVKDILNSEIEDLQIGTGISGKSGVSGEPLKAVKKENKAFEKREKALPSKSERTNEAYLCETESKPNSIKQKPKHNLVTPPKIQTLKSTHTIPKSTSQQMCSKISDRILKRNSNPSGTVRNVGIQTTNTNASKSLPSADFKEERPLKPPTASLTKKAPARQRTDTRILDNPNALPRKNNMSVVDTKSSSTPKDASIKTARIANESPRGKTPPGLKKTEFATTPKSSSLESAVSNSSKNKNASSPKPIPRVPKPEESSLKPTKFPVRPMTSAVGLDKTRNQIIRQKGLFSPGENEMFVYKVNAPELFTAVANGDVEGQVAILENALNNIILENVEPMVIEAPTKISDEASPTKVLKKKKRRKKIIKRKKNSNPLKRLFTSFAKFGDARNSGLRISQTNSDMWLKEARVLDNKRVNAMDTETYFIYHAKRKRSLSLDEYTCFLRTLTSEKRLEFKEVLSKMIACRGPRVHEEDNASTKAQKETVVKAESGDATGVQTNPDQIAPDTEIAEPKKKKKVTYHRMVRRKVSLLDYKDTLVSIPENHLVVLNNRKS